MNARAATRARLALDAAEADTPEEDAAVLMVALYQRKLRRHDADTAELAEHPDPAPSPQIRRAV